METQSLLKFGVTAKAVNGSACNNVRLDKRSTFIDPKSQSIPRINFVIRYR